jgi:hypothetical protein
MGQGASSHPQDRQSHVGEVTATTEGAIRGLAVSRCQRLTLGCLSLERPELRAETSQHRERDAGILLREPKEPLARS